MKNKAQVSENFICNSLETHAHTTQLGHDFGQAQKSSAQKATLIVAILNLVTMFVEIFVGIYTGSMALFADGIHMAGHSLALGLASFAYYLTYKNSNNRNYSLGSGKINELTAFTSGFFLLITVFWLIFESCKRLINPEQILAQEALAVAIIGLVVNLVSVLIMTKSGENSHQDSELNFSDIQQEHSQHRHSEHSHSKQGHSHHNNADHAHNHKDMNFKAALVHILTDAITSLAAILGLIAAWIWGIWWIDSAIALIASFWVLKWTWGLLKQTTNVLLDKEASQGIREQIAEEITKVEGSKLLDLHIWSVGQNAWTLVAVVLSSRENRPEIYKEQLKNLNFVHHPVIEIHFVPD